MKIIFIVGARPQFIKLAPLFKGLNKKHKKLIVHTGQHFDKEMSEIFFKDFSLPEPNYNLNILEKSHARQTGKMLIGLEKILLKEKPDIVIVFGDTNSTLAGALASTKLNIKTIHVEAGLRSYNNTMPEEINRIVTDHISDYLFAPTETAYNNLKTENLEKKSFLTGDIMVDSLQDSLKKINLKKILYKYKIKYNEYYLLTLHRPYNVDDPSKLKFIFEGLKNVKLKILFPIHPRTNRIIKDFNLKIPKKFRIVNPLGYLEFISLMKGAMKIITDSGGIQKEAYILKKPCITLRTETEWIETVKFGWNLLIDPLSTNNLSDIIDNFVPINEHYPLFGTSVAKRMVKIINKLG